MSLESVVITIMISLATALAIFYAVWVVWSEHKDNSPQESTGVEKLVEGGSPPIQTSETTNVVEYQSSASRNSLNNSSIVRTHPVDTSQMEVKSER